MLFTAIFPHPYSLSLFPNTQAWVVKSELIMFALGQNSIIIIPGANLLVDEADLEAAEATIASSKVVICQLEIEPKITLTALTMARKHGGNKHFSFNIFFFSPIKNRNNNFVKIYFVICKSFEYGAVGTFVIW